MKTPWGNLQELDHTDVDLACSILAADKHQLLEGLVVECLFDQILNSISPYADAALQVLDLETVIVDSQRADERWLALVFVRKRTKGLGRYIDALNKAFATFIVEIRDGAFMAARTAGGRVVSDWQQLSEVLAKISGQLPVAFQVDRSVRNRSRQQQAFWGFISSYYGPALWSKVVLPRIFINIAVQPYFGPVWNLDRVVLCDERLWLCEVKHKFPIDRGTLQFGLNEGELRVLELLAQAGVNCLHGVLVKPHWSKEVGSMYLLNDLTARARAALVATVLDAETTSRLLSKPSKVSGAHTSITGRSSLRYKTLNATDFARLGCLGEHPEEIASRLLGLLQGHRLHMVDDTWIRQLRLSPVVESLEAVDKKK